MMCQQCGKRPATAIYAEIASDKKSVVHLCQHCLAQKKGSHKLSEISFSIGGLLKEWLKSEGALAKASTAKCDRCGLTYAQFREHMKLGCSSCYDAFSAELDGLLEKIQGSNRHKGRTVASKGAATDGASVEPTTVELRDRLDKAIEQENFEEAARLRDEIALQKQKDKSAPGKGRARSGTGAQ